MHAAATILLPGLDGTGDLLEDFACSAPRGTDCLVVRYPPNELLDYGALTDYVAQRMPVDRPLVLIAESFSGPIAVRVAERMRNRVAALVLCNSFVTPPRSPLLRFVARPALFRMRMPDRVLTAMMLAPLATPKLVQAFAATLRKVDPDVVAYRVHQLLTVDDVATLCRVQAPITYVRGTLDRLVTEASLRTITNAVPSVRVRRIAAPHAILQTSPAEVWSALSEAI